MDTCGDLRTLQRWIRAYGLTDAMRSGGCRSFKVRVKVSRSSTCWRRTRDAGFVLSWREIQRWKGTKTADELEAAEMELMCTEDGSDDDDRGRATITAAAVGQIGAQRLEGQARHIYAGGNDAGGGQTTVSRSRM